MRLNLISCYPSYQLFKSISQIQIMSLTQRQNSYRESFSASHSRFRETHSPTVGRLHKQRQSFGPTVCLISKNPEDNIGTVDPSEDKKHIFMLILEIVRLNQKISSMKGHTEFESSQTEYLRKQVANLKHALESSENEKLLVNQNNSRFMSSQTNAMSDYEAQIAVGNRRVRQLEQRNALLKERIGQLEDEATRARAEASRLNMNILMNSQAQLQKSMARERGMEIDLWKEKLAKYQIIINDQKSYINSLRIEVERMKNGELQMRQRYDYQISHLRTDNQDLQKKAERFQRELTNQNLNTTQSRLREVELKQAQIQKLRGDVQYSKRDLEQMNIKYKILEESTEKQNGQLKEVIIDLREKLQAIYEQAPKDKSKSDRFRTEVAHLKLQNQNLRRQLMETKKRMGEQIDSLNQELEAKQGKLRKVVKKQRKMESQKRFSKSLSVADLRFQRTADTSKVSKEDLNGIIADVIELQDSNTRVSRLIEKKAIVGSQVSTNTYSTRIYTQNYGL